MGEFEEKLNAILSNPDALAQVANLAQSLNLGGSPENSAGESGGPGGAAGDASPSGGSPAGGAASSNGGGMPDLGAVAGLGELFGQIDPNLLQKLLPLVGELTGGGGNDERLQLLYALRPFLKPERRDKVERAVKTARLIHVGKKLLKNLGESYV